MDKYGFDWISFVLGIVLGMIILLILVWIAYNTRTFMFAYCARMQPECAGSDYYNDPGQALTEGAKIENILFLDDENILFYNRVPRNNSCIPGSNQLIPMEFPQYCSFTSATGSTIVGKSLMFGSESYALEGLPNTIVETIGNCVPQATSPAVVSGVPLLRWDPSPITQ